jgi:hypothetical protein
MVQEVHDYSEDPARPGITWRSSSTGGSSGLGGSPIGPLENSHTGRLVRASALRSMSCLAASSQCPAYTALQVDFRADATRLDVPVYFAQGAHEARGRALIFEE